MASLSRPRHFQAEWELELVRRVLGWTSPELVERIRAGSVPLGKLRHGEFVLFISYASAGLTLPLSSFFLLLLEGYGLQLQHLTPPHSILQVAIFVHLCEMFVGVRPCLTLFRNFFVLVKSGKSKDEIVVYYFQTRSGSSTPYLHALANGPTSDSKDWRAKPILPTEFGSVLGKIRELVEGGLTSMHVLRDFLKRRIAPL